MMSENKTYLNMEVSKHEYLFMLYFLSLCGNVFFETYLPTTIYVITALLFIMLYMFNSKIKCRIKKYDLNNILIMITTFILLFFAQYVVFGWNTVPGIIMQVYSWCWFYIVSRISFSYCFFQNHLLYMFSCFTFMDLATNYRWYKWFVMELR